MKPKRKYVVLEVETNLTNKELKNRELWKQTLEEEPTFYRTTLIQIQVNTVKPIK
jgi:hypothetical protein